MTALVYLLPILTCIFLYSTTPVPLSWEYYACCVGGSWLLTALIHWLMYRSRISDDEFLGSYINKVTHEEAWTELVYYIERVPCGRDSNGNVLYKNVQRVRHVFHPELWEMFSSYGTVQRISRSYYDHIRSTWGTPESRLHFTGANIMGGVETHCEELFPRLAAMGYDIIVFRRSAYVDSSVDEASGVRLHIWKSIRLIDLKSPKANWN